MRRLRQWYRQMVSLVRRDRLDRDIEDELAFHLAMRQAEHVSAGANDADAARAARRQFGNVALMKERTRDAWSFPSLESLLRDIRFGGRTLHAWHGAGHARDFRSAKTRDAGARTRVPARRRPSRQ
jgi:hypothetical protein